MKELLEVPRGWVLAWCGDDAHVPCWRALSGAPVLLWLQPPADSHPERQQAKAHVTGSLPRMAEV